MHGHPLPCMAIQYVQSMSEPSAAANILPQARSAQCMPSCRLHMHVTALHGPMHRAATAVKPIKAAQQHERNNYRSKFYQQNTCLLLTLQQACIAIATVTVAPKFHSIMVITGLPHALSQQSPCHGKDCPSWLCVGPFLLQIRANAILIHADSDSFVNF